VSVWREVARSYLEEHGDAGEAAAVIERLRLGSPLDVTEALAPDAARRWKHKTTAFLLAGLEIALGDHALSDDEMREFKHLRRVFRLSEGDFLAHNHVEVVNLLSWEIRRILADGVVSLDEALHEVKLQEAFGLGYDEYANLIAKEIEGMGPGLR
jgi:hypothetical protein